jgi:hypothetical protein
MSVALIHFPEEALDRAMRVLDLLAAKDVLGVSLPALLSGRVEPSDATRPCVLPLFEARHRETLAWWALLTGPLGYASVAIVDSALLGEQGLTAGEVALLLGHGIVLASSGDDGLPLIGLSAVELREALTVSQRALSSLSPYEATMLCPRPNDLDVAFDGLVESEARRAGFRLFFAPGPGIDEGSRSVMTYRSIEPDAAPAEIRRWVLGEGFSRQRAQFERYRQLSKRLLALASLRAGEASSEQP